MHECKAAEILKVLLIGQAALYVTASFTCLEKPSQLSSFKLSFKLSSYKLCATWCRDFIAIGTICIALLIFCALSLRQNRSQEQITKRVSTAVRETKVRQKLI